MFSDSTQPLTLRNLTYERVAVLVNLGALHCQLGLSEDRTSPQGLKKAIAYFQVRLSIRAKLHLVTATPECRRDLRSSHLERPS